MTQTEVNHAHIARAVLADPLFKHTPSWFGDGSYSPIYLFWADKGKAA